MNLLYFVLCAFGMTFIIVYGSIFNKIRPKQGFLGELLNCPLCTGFWVGVFLWSINCLTQLFTFDYSIVTGFLLGCLSAGTTYILSMMIDDFGIKLNLKQEVKHETSQSNGGKTLLQG